MTKSKAEIASDSDELHLVSAVDAAVDERDQEHPNASLIGRADDLREIHAAAKTFAESPEPADVAAAAFVETLRATQARPLTEDGFQWDAQDNDSVVCVEQRAIAVYTNVYGQAVIRQERSWDEDEDTWIRISKPFLQDVIDRLQAILSEG